MTIRSQVACLTTIAALLCAGSTYAQQRTPGAPAGAPAPRSAGTNVALIDISYLFKNHVRFKERTDAIKQEIKDYEGQMNEQRKLLNDKRTALSEFKPGSPEYSKLEQEIAREIANQNVGAELKRKEILEREAKIYFETYNEIVGAVSAFSQQNNIGLVLRFDSEKIDANDRAAILRGVNRAVVFQDQINITEQILSMINVNRTAARPQSQPKPQQN